MATRIKQVREGTRRRAVVTGATFGIGFATATALAARGWDLAVVGRPGPKLIGAADHQWDAGAEVDAIAADLSDLGQAHDAARRLRDDGRRIDLLVCCAGVMAPPSRTDGAQVHELQLTVNHLAHHVLAATLLPRLRESPAGRIVSVSSVAHRNPAAERPWDPEPYRPHDSYAASKLWQLAWALALDNHLATDPSGLRSVAAHPGWSRTALFSSGPALNGGSVEGRVLDLATRLIAQPAPRGAIPVLAAALERLPNEPAHLGPSGFMEMAGRSWKPARIAPVARDETFRAMVWNKTAELTALTMPG